MVAWEVLGSPKYPAAVLDWQGSMSCPFVCGLLWDFQGKWCPLLKDVDDFVALTANLGLVGSR